MVDSRQTGERSGIIPWIRQCVLFRHHVPPRDRAAAVVLSPSLRRRRRGLPQHVSEKNVAFMALLCVYAVIRQIIQEGLASFSGTPTFSGGYIQAVYLFCL